jgi:hypothetical protein
VAVRVGTEGAILLSGVCPGEDAEVLLQRLIDRPGSTIDWRACEEAHGAVVQVLLASGSIVQGPPMGHFLRRFVAPLLERAGGTEPRSG